MQSCFGLIFRWFTFYFPSVFMVRKSLVLQKTTNIVHEKLMQLKHFLHEMWNNVFGGNFPSERLQFMGGSGKKCVGELLPHIPQFTVFCLWICVFQNFATPAYSTFYGNFNLCTFVFSWSRKYQFWLAAFSTLWCNFKYLYFLKEGETFLGELLYCTTPAFARINV